MHTQPSLARRANEKIARVFDYAPLKSLQASFES